MTPDYVTTGIVSDCADHIEFKDAAAGLFFSAVILSNYMFFF